MTTQRRGQGKAPRKKATDKRPVTDEVKFLLDLSLLPPLNQANDQLLVERAVLDRLKTTPVPDTVNADIWAAQLEIAQEAVTKAEEAVAKAQAAVDAETFVFKLRAVSPKRYFEIAAEHPPTPEQIEKADSMAEKAGAFEGKTEAERRRMQIDFNPDTFPRAIVEACNVELDADELDAFFDEDGTWTNFDRDEVFNRALAVCQRASILRR